LQAFQSDEAYVQIGKSGSPKRGLKRANRLEERWNVILELPQTEKWSPLCFSFPEKNHQPQVTFIGVQTKTKDREAKVGSNQLG